MRGLGGSFKSVLEMKRRMGMRLRDGWWTDLKGWTPISSLLCRYPRAFIFQPWDVVGVTKGVIRDACRET
jgi:hypothetical protein